MSIRKKTNDRKEEAKLTNGKPTELSDDEVEQVAGGVALPDADGSGVVEMNIAPVIYKGEVLVPAAIEVSEEDKALLP